MLASMTVSTHAEPAASPTVMPDVPVTPRDERVQFGSNSPTLAVDPSDPRFVTLASRFDNPDFGCALHLSGNGGLGWVPAFPVTERSLPRGTEKCYAPEVAFDARGTLYYLYIGLAGPGNSPSGTFLVTTRDRGRSFTRSRRLLGRERYMVRMAIDRSAGKQGRMHIVWLEAGTDPPLGGLAPPPNPIFTAYSDDGGRTFSKPLRLSDPSRRVVAPALTLAPGGRVHVAFYDLEDDARDYQGLEGPVWEGRWSLHAVSSVDGGRSFGPAAIVDREVVPPERIMLIYTMPPPTLAAGGSGSVFAAWHDARNGDWDALLRRSDDGGRTWHAPVRLNDDEVRSGRHQYLPRLSVGPDGRLDVVFYDRRNDPENLRNDVFFTSSSDGGRSFTKNLRVNSESFHSQIGTRYPIPSARGLVEYGSRIAVASLRTRALAAWTDTRLSDLEAFSQDVFATQVVLSQQSEPVPRPPRTRVSATALLLGAGLVIVAGSGVILGIRRRRKRVAESV